MRDIFLIGGVPSSGSTLLVSVLARHEGLLCLPETGLFAHGRNLTDMSAPVDERDSLDWHLPWLLTGLKVAQAFGWEKSRYEQAGERYKTAFDLVRAEVDPHSDYTIIEKTPENIFAFREYLSQSKDNRVVVTSRDVVGVMQSLVRRGFNLVEALLSWFAHSYETARLIVDFPEQVFQCRYDRLTADPDGETTALLQFLNIAQSQSSAPGVGRSGSGARPESIRDGVSNLLTVSSWGLSETSWSHSPSAAVRVNAPINLLGQEFGMLMDLIAFRTEAHGLMRPGVLDSVLHGDRDLARDDDLEGEPADCALQSVLTRSLAHRYAPFLLRI